jgi:hypothetical protein
MSKANERVRGSIIFLLFLLSFPSRSWADQYLTDTPVTLDYGQINADIYSDITKVKEDCGLRAPGFEARVGVLTDFQLRLNIPVAVSTSPGLTTTYGYGDIDIGFKYRFIHETETIPQVAFYPKFTLPSGFAPLRLGNGRNFERLPIWLQKTWEPWKLSGGGGYAIDHNPRKFNYIFGGALLRYTFNPELTLGGELFARGPVNLNDHSVLIFNFGGTYNFTPDIFMLFSAGHSIAGTKTLKGFLGLGMSWGASECEDKP